MIVPIISRSATWSSLRWKLCAVRMTISKLRGRRRARGEPSPAPPSPPVHTPESVETADAAPEIIPHV